MALNRRRLWRDESSHLKDITNSDIAVSVSLILFAAAGMISDVT